MNDNSNKDSAPSNKTSSWEKENNTSITTEKSSWADDFDVSTSNNHSSWVDDDNKGQPEDNYNSDEIKGRYIFIVVIDIKNRK